MKFSIKERGSKEYYNEFLYVAFNYKMFLKNPHKKTHKLTNMLLYYGIMLLLFIGLFIYFYMDESNSFYLICTGIFIFVFILDVFIYISCIKRIKNYINDKGIKHVNIEKEYVEYKDDNKSFKVKFKDIKCVIMNKYSICFIPNSLNNAIISMTIEYKNDIINVLKKYKREELIINNWKEE